MKWMFVGGPYDGTAAELPDNVRPATLSYFDMEKKRVAYYYFAISSRACAESPTGRRRFLLAWHSTVKYDDRRPVTISEPRGLTHQHEIERKAVELGAFDNETRRSAELRYYSNDVIDVGDPGHE